MGDFGGVPEMNNLNWTQGMELFKNNPHQQQSDLPRSL